MWFGQYDVQRKGHDDWNISARIGIYTDYSSSSMKGMAADFQSLRAISGMVNAILGIIPLLLAYRTKNNSWSEQSEPIDLVDAGANGLD